MTRAPAPGPEAPPAWLATLGSRRCSARLGHTVRWCPSVDSTNAWARRLAAAGAPEGTLAVAGAQEAGRGRHGRRWESPAGLGLYCSLVVSPRLEPGRLGLVTLAAGVAAARAVRRRARVPALLEWPNDLVLRGRKLGGILVETSTMGERREPAIVGWGLNLEQRRADFPAPLRARATSLALAGARPAGRATLLATYLGELERLLGLLEAGGTQAMLRSYTRLAPASEGAELLLDLAGRHRRAVSRGLTQDGALRVELPEGPRILRSADVLRVVRTRTCCSR